MLFNSYVFIFVFLPIVFCIHFFLASRNLIKLAKLWLVLGSLFFYGYWSPVYVPLIFGSMLVNFVCGLLLSRCKDCNDVNGVGHSRFFLRFWLLLGGVGFNLALLAYFKYVDFFLESVNYVFGSDYLLPNIVLPLGISFFTFTQIAFLVDAYRYQAKEYSLINYSLFVTYFPHLLAGPILHHKEMMPQFAEHANYKLNYRNLALGLFIFALGLFKKVVIADTFASWANQGYAQVDQLTMLEAWLTSLSYTFQLYFDFSGYTDMAIGISLLFNIRLPTNFNSPYKALSIQDFWRRWHITLSRFLRNYLYIPLGGNRKGQVATYINLMLTFVIGGLWHGAGWTFVIWGALHGCALVVHRFWQQLGLRLPKLLAWLITFNFVNLAWVFFRADNGQQAITLIRTMFDPERLVLLAILQPKLGFLQEYGIHFGASVPHLDNDGGKFLLIATLLAGLSVVLLRNSQERALAFRAGRADMLTFLVCLISSLVLMSKASEFIYFNF